jgi:hypothetical protein
MKKGFWLKLWLTCQILAAGTFYAGGKIVALVLGSAALFDRLDGLPAVEGGDGGERKGALKRGVPWEEAVGLIRVMAVIVAVLLFFWGGALVINLAPRDRGDADKPAESVAGVYTYEYPIREGDVPGLIAEDCGARGKKARDDMVRTMAELNESNTLPSPGQSILVPSDWRCERLREPAQSAGK